MAISKCGIVGLARVYPISIMKAINTGTKLSRTNCGLNIKMTRNNFHTAVTLLSTRNFSLPLVGAKITT